MKDKRRIILVSNRLSVSVKRTGPGEFDFQPSIGGLATGLSSLRNDAGLIWVGWSGIPEDRLERGESRELRKRLMSEYGAHAVPLTAEQLKSYYHGFSNDTIWPLFHYFPEQTNYEPRQWEVYREVNRLFFESIKKIGREDDIFWVHDYQLMLLPEMIRKEFPRALVGFFLHIPFPSYEIFRLLPWRKEILDGILGADLVGFHTYDYARHFLSSVRRLLGYDHNLGLIRRGMEATRVDVFPMGIDYEKFRRAAESSAEAGETKKIRNQLQGRRVILSVDRLDYSKGIPLRLRGYARLLQTRPEYREKVVLVMIVAPSRAEVKRYRELRREIEELVGYINGTYGSMGWDPVRYFYRSFTQEKLISLYVAAETLLVTPLRDGMNLVAKEYLAARTVEGGTLVLSETAGAADELGEAFIVNPNDAEDIARSLAAALEISPEERLDRSRKMIRRIRDYTVTYWAGDFLEHLIGTRDNIQKVRRKLAGPVRRRVLDSYRNAERRLLLLDYDGTLRGFTGRPEDAVPGPEVLDVLEKLAGDRKNVVVIVSGRDRDFLEKHLGSRNLSFVAGHGVWIKSGEGGWTTAEPMSEDWKSILLPIMERFSLRTPGSSVEEKEFSLAWHYRRAEPDLAAVRVAQLKEALLGFISSYGLTVLEGHRVLEVKPAGINKGRGAGMFIGHEAWDFILAAGDDVTDEDLFAAVPKRGVTIKVGSGFSRARFSLATPAEVLALLLEMENS